MGRIGKCLRHTTSFVGKTLSAPIQPNLSSDKFLAQSDGCWVISQPERRSACSGQVGSSGCIISCFSSCCSFGLLRPWQLERLPGISRDTSSVCQYQSVWAYRSQRFLRLSWLCAHWPIGGL